MNLRILAVGAVLVWTSCVAAWAGEGIEHALSKTADPIDALVTKLSKPPAVYLWQNGVSPKLDLPAAASIEKVVARVFEMTGFDQGRVKNYRIVETRTVRIPGSLPDEYTAVLVDTDLGRKVVLLQHTGSAVGWWSRVYDASASA